MSNKVIFQDDQCLGERCRFSDEQKQRLQLISEEYSGKVAVGTCFGRSLTEVCALKAVGGFSSEEAEELETLFTEEGEVTVIKE